MLVSTFTSVLVLLWQLYLVTGRWEVYLVLCLCECMVCLCVCVSTCICLFVLVISLCALFYLLGFLCCFLRSFLFLFLSVFCYKTCPFRFIISLLGAWFVCVPAFFRTYWHGCRSSCLDALSSKHIVVSKVGLQVFACMPNETTLVSVERERDQWIGKQACRWSDRQKKPDRRIVDGQ